MRYEMQRAFSLIESVLVIGIIALLLAILFPTLASIRNRAENTYTVAQLRSHAQVFTMYAGDHSDAWPVFINPTAEPTWVLSGQYGAELYYFEQCASWNIALADTYYNADPTAPEFFPPNYEDPSIDQYNFFTPLLYSCSLIADPTYWEYENRRDDYSQWNGTRVDQVRFPAAKSLLVDAWRHPDWTGPERRSPLIRMALTDGSASEFASSHVRSGYSRGDGMMQGGHPSDPPRGLHTLSGIHGRDISRSR